MRSQVSNELSILCVGDMRSWLWTCSLGPKFTLMPSYLKDANFVYTYILVLGVVVWNGMKQWCMFLSSAMSIWLLQPLFYSLWARMRSADEFCISEIGWKLWFLVTYNSQACLCMLKTHWNVGKSCEVSFWLMILPCSYIGWILSKVSNYESSVETLSHNRFDWFISSFTHAVERDPCCLISQHGDWLLYIFVNEGAFGETWTRSKVFCTGSGYCREACRCNRGSFPTSWERRVVFWTWGH